MIGTRNFLKALLRALLEPTPLLQGAEQSGDYTARLALLEDVKTLPVGAVWQAYCDRAGVPDDGGWLSEIKRYEREVLSLRLD